MLKSCVKTNKTASLKFNHSFFCSIHLNSFHSKLMISSFLLYIQHKQKFSYSWILSLKYFLKCLIKLIQINEIFYFGNLEFRNIFGYLYKKVAIKKYFSFKFARLNTILQKHFLIF